MTLYLSSDQHFEHHKLILNGGRKGFASGEEHDTVLIEHINAKVQPNDVLAILGDFSWKKPGRFRQQIKCKSIVFIIGNHDPVTASKNVFGELKDMREFKLFNGMQMFCSHYPQAYWRNSHHGSLHCYGHMHANREETLDTLFPERRSMDVGIDNAIQLLGKPEPFSEHEIVEILGKRLGHDRVEFYKNLRGELDE